MRPRGAEIFRPRSKTMPIVIFLAVMFATVGLAFLLENLRPRARPGEPVEVAHEAPHDAAPRSAMSSFAVRKRRRPGRSLPAASSRARCARLLDGRRSRAAFSLRGAAGVVVLVTLVGAGSGRRTSAGRGCWRRLILVILFIPIRRYSLPGNLPFELEPYRLLVALLLVGWGASLLVDPRDAIPRDRLRRRRCC